MFQIYHRIDVLLANTECDEFLWSVRLDADRAFILNQKRAFYLIIKNKLEMNAKDESCNMIQLFMNFIQKYLCKNKQASIQVKYIKYFPDVNYLNANLIFLNYLNYFYTYNYFLFIKNNFLEKLKIILGFTRNFIVRIIIWWSF